MQLDRFEEEHVGEGTGGQVVEDAKGSEISPISFLIQNSIAKNESTVHT